MIESFLASWPLFQNTYLAGWTIAVLLSLVGVLVVARDQIFIGAAISQASTLGIAAAIWLAGHLPVALSPLAGDSLHAGMAVLFSVVATLITARAGGSGRETHEAVTGWIFLVAASLSILSLAHSPHGLEEIHRIVASSLIGSDARDVAVFAALALLSAAVLGTARSRLLLLATDPLMARAIGMRLGVWNAGIAIWLGLSIGLSIRASGLLFTFGCLVLPALVAKNLCREMRRLVIVSPLVALLASVVGFVLANHYDLPPAQTSTVLLCAALAGAWSWRRARPVSHGGEPRGSASGALVSGSPSALRQRSGGL
ncbi:MAG: metal ABC transporter permease [Myxococcota bacterium]